jgi:hypothetical protein
VWPASWPARLALAAAIVTATAADMTASRDALSLLAPAMSAADRVRLDAGQTVVKVLPAGGRALAAVAAVRVTVPPERLLAWTADIAALRRSRYVPLIARVSSPPAVEDFDALVLDERDLDDLRRCRPGDCGLKLGAAEIERLRRSTGGQADWRSAVQQEFRRVLVDRVERYLAEGDAGLPAYEDHSTPVVPSDEMALLVDAIGLAAADLPGVAEAVRLFPRAAHPDVVESFVYWAREIFGGKPIVSLTHVTVLRGTTADGAVALTISKQLYASHYRNASLSLTALVESGTGRHLVHAQRSHVDVLQGFLGGLARRMVEGRIREEAPAALAAVKARLESGDPPVSPPDPPRNLSR